MKPIMIAVFVLISIVSSPVFAVPINNMDTNSATGLFGTVTVTKSAPVFSVVEGQDVTYSYLIERTGSNALVFTYFDDVVKDVAGGAAFFGDGILPIVSDPYTVNDTVTNIFTVEFQSEGNTVRIQSKITVEAKKAGGSVPEPATLALLGLSLAIFGFGRKIIA